MMGLQLFAEVRTETKSTVLFSFSTSSNFELVLSIFCSMQQYFVTAHVLIFLGYEFDRFDGIVARWRNECSDLGKQLDSLSDLVRFPSP